MESPLEVLSRAATMVQDKATSESKLPNKELPTTKWRRERRRLSEYQTNSSINNNNMPITATIKARSPPPYREPLPGSTFALSLVRPTVITVGPKAVKEEILSVNSSTTVVLSPKSSPVVATSPVASKRSETSSSSTLLGSRSNVSPSPSVGPSSPRVLQQQQLNNNNNCSSKNDKLSESISMCDTVIDEHFRRSLGNNYMELFDKGTGAATTPANGSSSPPGEPTVLPTKRAVSPATVVAPPMKKSNNVSVSVDDHFAKALGETWNKLKATQGRHEEDDLGDEEEDEEMYTSEEDDDGDDDDDVLSSEEEDIRRNRGRIRGNISNGNKYNNNKTGVTGRRQK